MVNATLKQRLAQGGPLCGVGIYDALTATIAEQVGFEAAFLSGSAVAYSQLARPDIGLVTLTEMALALDRIRDRVDIHLLVDADSGFGNAFNVQRTVRTLERAGANGIQLEDQYNTKAPGEVTKRPVISTEAMVGNIKAALDAREHDSTVISARTDAVFTLGVEEAMARAEAFLDAGADMVFVEGLKQPEDIQRLTALCRGRAPVLYNLIDPSLFSTTQLREMGVSMALYPAVVINAVANAARQSAQQLAFDLGINSQSVAAVEPINTIIGSDDFLARGYHYDAQ